jgi:hypothetical protein
VGQIGGGLELEPEIGPCELAGSSHSTFRTPIPLGTVVAAATSGEVPEWPKGTVLKTVEVYSLRGFESHPHRRFMQSCTIDFAQKAAGGRLVGKLVPRACQSGSQVAVILGSHRSIHEPAVRQWYANRYSVAIHENYR